MPPSIAPRRDVWFVEFEGATERVVIELDIEVVDVRGVELRAISVNRLHGCKGLLTMSSMLVAVQPQFLH